MNAFDFMKNDYFRLFVKREAKVVLGKNASNLWLLAVVMTATFLAIAFSNASLDYLAYKMDDPFINWVDIKNDYGDGNFAGLENALDDESNKDLYHYESYQSDYYFSYMFFSKDGEGLQYFKCRFFQDMRTPLMDAILSKDNTIKNWKLESLEELDPNTIGLIITEEAMTKMGYDTAPSYIYLEGYCNEDEAQYYAVDLYHDKFVMLPVPVLAVVKSLPGNVDILSSAYFYKQLNNDNTYPFDLANDDFASSLVYFIPEGVDLSSFKNFAAGQGSQYTDAEIEFDEYSFYAPELVPFRKGKFIKILSYDDVDYESWASINKAILKKYSVSDVHRVYDYDFSDFSLSQKAYISVYFKDLNKLRDFETYVREKFNVKIEMAQINAKENFNAVSLMGNILSWVIIVFAIVCICLFVMNLLQSYFQKVKRNMGTFKAFGIPNRSLIGIYVLIMVAIIIVAILLSLSVTWMLQGLLHVCGLLKDGVFDYLSLWSYKTVFSVIIIIAASVVTVYGVMHKLLKSTPGDLIYDRQ